MTKEEQIKAWYDKNKYHIDNTFEYLCLDYQSRKNNIKEFFRKNWWFLTEMIDSLQYNMVLGGDFYEVVCMSAFYLDYKNFGVFYSFLSNILIRKNNDYGNSFDRSIDKFGWVYLAMELDKKKNRLKNLLRNKQAPNYESLEDTLLDIAGYCVLALIYLENKEYK